jgi:hypothetical protein
LTPRNIRLIVEAGLDEITLSMHGITKESYEKFTQGASFETFHRAPRTIVKLRRKIWGSGTRPGTAMPIIIAVSAKTAKLP